MSYNDEVEFVNKENVEDVVEKVRFAWERTSRKFRVMLYDMIVAVILLVGGWFLAPDDLDKVIQVIAIIQPVVLAMILGTAWEDASAKKRPPVTDSPAPLITDVTLDTEEFDTVIKAAVASELENVVVERSYG